MVSQQPHYQSCPRAEAKRTGLHTYTLCTCQTPLNRMPSTSGPVLTKAWCSRLTTTRLWQVNVVYVLTSSKLPQQPATCFLFVSVQMVEECSDDMCLDDASYWGRRICSCTKCEIFFLHLGLNVIFESTKPDKRVHLNLLLHFECGPFMSLQPAQGPGRVMLCHIHLSFCPSWF